eukprot:GHVP01030503.1.p1 GENE.GHVP01030503.1~~GHVP01030503.1.p1  ORF type:complete len:101 (-),score=17.54 GHVP01030503.1:483-785(-)
MGDFEEDKLKFMRKEYQYKDMYGNDIKETCDMLLRKDWKNEKIKHVVGVSVQKRLAYLKKTSSRKAVVVTRDETTATRLQDYNPDDYAVYCAVEELDKNS